MGIIGSHIGVVGSHMGVIGRHMGSNGPRKAVGRASPASILAQLPTIARPLADALGVQVL